VSSNFENTSLSAEKNAPIIRSPLGSLNSSYIQFISLRTHTCGLNERVNNILIVAFRYDLCARALPISRLGSRIFSAQRLRRNKALFPRIKVVSVHCNPYLLIFCRFFSTATGISALCTCSTKCLRYSSRNLFDK
jgi:hypothetical protein